MTLQGTIACLVYEAEGNHDGYLATPTNAAEDSLTLHWPRFVGGLSTRRPSSPVARAECTNTEDELNRMVQRGSRRSLLLQKCRLGRVAARPL